MPAVIDRTGRQYSRLTVIGLSERKTNNGRKLWLCECRCGNRQADFFKANEPMSADIAKMLGISSWECENEKTD